MEKLAKQIRKKLSLMGSLNWPKNWILKVISLLFALTLWYFVVGEAKVDITMFVPLEIVNLPQDLVISNQFKKKLEVTVNGPRGLTRNIRDQHFSRPVDMSQAKPGTMVIQNTPDSLNFPRGIRILRIQPTNITIKIDRILKTDLPIKAKVKGKAASGFDIASVSVQPKTIEITAPSKLLKPVLFLPTQDIDLDGISQSQTIETKLVLPPEIAELVGDPLIKAKVTVREQMIEKEVSHLKITPPPLKVKKFRISPDEVSIKAQAPYHFIHGKNMVALKKQFRVNLAGKLPTSAGKHKIKVVASGAPGMVINEINPPEVTLEIIPKEKKRQKVRVIIKNGGGK